MKIYARKCEIKKIENLEVKDFLEKYHLQGNCSGQKYCYGLYYQNELVGLMTFGYPRYNPNVSFELLRLCYKKDITVIGGSLKLFNYFLKDKNPTSVISYCDTSHFSGDIYLKMGFKLLNKGKESIIWKKENKFITHTQLLKYGADKLIGTKDGKGTSNEEILKREGWVSEPWAAQDSYIWSASCEGIIYKITNLLNNKVYIGQTKKTLEERWVMHCRDNDTPIDKEIHKIGKDNFTYETIDYTANFYELNKKERYWIRKYNSVEEGYNILAGGNGVYQGTGGLNRPMTEEEKQLRKDWYTNLSETQKQEFKLKSHNGKTSEEKRQLAKNWYQNATEEQKEEIKRKRREALIKKGIWKAKNNPSLN